MEHPGQILGLASTIVIAAIVITAVVMLLAKPVTKLCRWLHSHLVRTVDEHAAHCRKHGQE